jgi:predicted transposase YbfD/YdcC
MTIIRSHWAIENKLHWVLDVVMGEDQMRNRKDHGPENLALLKRIALNIARNHPDKSMSMRRKFKRAGWDDKSFFSLCSYLR